MLNSMTRIFIRTSKFWLSLGYSYFFANFRLKCFRNVSCLLSSLKGLKRAWDQHFHYRFLKFQPQIVLNLRLGFSQNWAIEYRFSIKWTVVRSTKYNRSKSHVPGVSIQSTDLKSLFKMLMLLVLCFCACRRSKEKD